MKSRWWCFTNFDLDFDWNHLFENETCIVYLAYGEEVCPSTGREHQQGWIYFKNSKASTRDILGTMHAEVMRGNIKQNDAYCSKEGSLIEYGVKPKQGARRDIAAVFEAIREGESELSLAETNPSQWVQYGRRFEDYRRLLVPRRMWKTEVHVYWGETKSGKTHRAWEVTGGRDNPQTVSIGYTSGGFFTNYHGEPNVILDDFDGNMPRELFLQITDRYPMHVNVKNSSVQWAPKRLIITSNFPPERWYGTYDAEKGVWVGDAAVMRRLDIVEQMSGAEVP